MKKQIKKLSLHRETLRSLTETELNAADGAVDPSIRYSRCINTSCGIACSIDC